MGRPHAAGGLGCGDGYPRPRIPPKQTPAIADCGGGGVVKGGGARRTGERACGILGLQRHSPLPRAATAMRRREIWDGAGGSKQGWLDLLRPLMKAGLVRRIGTKKTGRYVLT